FVQEQWFEHVNYDGKQQPDCNHQMEPPERELREPVPCIQRKQHVNPGKPGYEDGDACLLGEAALESFESLEGFDSCGPLAESSRLRQHDRGHDRNTADPVNDREDVD